MKNILSVFLVVILLSGCASTQSIGVDDPFSDQLHYYYHRQQSGKTGFLVSALAFALSFAAGTFFLTTRSLQGESPGNTFGLTASYILTPVSFGLGAFYFHRWSKNSDLYLQTLQYQTQYYNIAPPEYDE